MRLVKITIALLLVLFTPGLKAQEWLSEVGAKSFPLGEKVYRVNDYGAKKGKFDNSSVAIQKAIDECSANGGGKVVFDPGVYHTGALFLKSNVNFEIGEGVELKALMGLEYYPEIKTRVAGIEMMWPCGVINILDQENVAITGKGTLHAQGKIHWERYWNLRADYTPKGLRWASDYDCKRVRTVEVSNCKNITIKDITVKQSGFWTVHVMYCKYVTVDGVKVWNNIDGKGPSTDGIDIDSSSYIEVMNCETDCNDDNYCVKAGRDADGLRVNIPSEYVYFHDCIAHGGGGALVLGSETSGWIRHVKAENMKCIGSGHILHIKSAFTRGGGVDDIDVVNCHGEKLKNFLQVTVNWNPTYSYATLPEGITEMPEHWKVMTQEVPKEQGIPNFSNVRVSNCSSVDTREDAFHVEGIEDSYITGFVVKDVKVSASRTGYLKYVKNWTLENVEITSKDGKELLVENNKKVKMKNVVVNKSDN